MEIIINNNSTNKINNNNIKTNINNNNNHSTKTHSNRITLNKKEKEIHKWKIILKNKTTYRPTKKKRKIIDEYRTPR